MGSAGLWVGPVWRQFLGIPHLLSALSPVGQMWHESTPGLLQRKGSPSGSSGPAELQPGCALSMRACVCTRVCMHTCAWVLGFAQLVPVPWYSTTHG